MRLGDVEELARAVEGQPPDEDRVHEREDGGVQADAETQGEGGYQREPGSRTSSRAA